MAKKKQDIEVIDPQVIKVDKTKHVLKGNVGNQKDGSPKKKKGSTVLLTEEQVKQYKKQNLI